MSEKPSSLLPEDATGRDRLRAVLTLLCVVAVVLAGTVVPATSGAGLGRTPLGSILPTPGVNVYGPSGSAGGGAAGAGGLGALNPGERTSVGGSLASNESAFRSRNAEVHFTVRSTRTAYWRTGAYDTYTGSGWEQSGERRPYTDPVETDGIRGRRVEYRVTLNRSATALPTVWRANSVSVSGADPSLYVTDSRAFETGESVAAGTTYSGVSHLAPRQPNVLRTAGRNYPAEIERRYTALPEDTRRRVGEFTAELTADADSPYETAKRVESWLEANKNYSLDAPKPDGDVASQFIFEMEEGYCEYFATSMTVMLRSQGIPARYVVGYSTGQRVGANTYAVRGMNAHAWVEVYFPDVGWVKFDPTPGRARLRTERQAYRNQTPDSASEYEPTERGSPGEEFSANGSADATAAPASATATPGGTVSSPRTATPSGTVTATASGDGDATSSGATRTPDSPPTGEATETGGTTRFDDSTTAGTDETTTRSEGTDETTAPDDGDDSPGETRYEVELNRTPVPGATVEVTVRPRENATLVVGAPVYFNGEYVGETDESGTVIAEVPYAENLTITVGGGSDERDDATALSGPPPNLDAPMALTAGPPRVLSPGNRTNGTEYSLATNATLAVTGDAETGSRVVVTATVHGVPVRDAAVRLDGERVATTDRSGRAEVGLPESPGNVTLSVSRGPVSGETTVTIPRLAVAVEPSLPLALPGTSVEIRATYGGDPVSDARVRLGDRNLSTDFDGSAAAALPFRASATVVVSARGQTRRTSVSGLFVNLALVLGGAAVVLGGLGFGAYRRGFGPRRLLALALAALRAVPGLAVGVLFAATDRIEWAIRTLLDAVRDLLAGETTPSELLERLRAWLRERTRSARANASATLAGVASRTPTAAGNGGEDDSYRTLREAWDSFLAAVSVRQPESATPGELADHAIREDDLPPGAVVTLRDAFRDVEYGARSPADRLPRVEEAAATIERAHREAAAGGSGTADDGETDEDATETTDEATAQAGGAT